MPKTKSLDALLQAWAVGYVDAHHRIVVNAKCPPIGWYHVSNNSGVVAYFGREGDAYAYRLMCINNELNKTSKAAGRTRRKKAK